MANVQKVVIDGKVVEAQVLSAKEAAELERAPKVKSALDILTGGKNPELAAWLYDNKNDIQATYDTGTVRRVTKQEKKALEKALDIHSAS